MKKQIITALIAMAIASTAAADGYCRHPKAYMNVDDYHRIKRLLPQPVKIERYNKNGEPKLVLSFKDLEGDHKAAIENTLKPYGGLNCRDAKWYQDRSIAITHKTDDGVIVDCVVIFDDIVTETECLYRK